MIKNTSTPVLFKIKILKSLYLVSIAIYLASSHRVTKPLLFKMISAPSRIFITEMKSPQNNKIRSKMILKTKNFTLKNAMYSKCYLPLKLIWKTLPTKSLWRCRCSEILKVLLILLSTKFLEILTPDGMKIVLLANLEMKKKTF